MKREYSSPVMEVEVFEASEYIATCVKSDVLGAGELWDENYRQPGLQTEGYNKDYFITTDICTKNHKIQNKPLYQKGYWKQEDGQVVDVYWWKDLLEYGRYHAVINKGSFEQSLTNAS